MHRMWQCYIHHYISSRGLHVFAKCKVKYCYYHEVVSHSRFSRLADGDKINGRAVLFTVCSLCIRDINSWGLGMIISTCLLNENYPAQMVARTMSLWIAQFKPRSRGNMDDEFYRLCTTIMNNSNTRIIWESWSWWSYKHKIFSVIKAYISYNFRYHGA